VCTRSLQVHGGYGYCTEYKVEQFVRDSKIATIFEGTNGIQALDLFGRKIRMRDGAALQRVLDKMNDTVAAASNISELSSYAEALDKSIAAFQEITKQLLAQSTSEDAYLAYSWATPYLEIFGDIVLGWILLWQAHIALEEGAKNSGDAQFYLSKVTTAKFYIGSVLPLIYGKIEAIRINDKALSSPEASIFLD